MPKELLRLKESYPNQFWNSGDGFTILKTDRVGKEADLDNNIIKAAVDHGTLEIVPRKENNLNIISDTPPKKTIKEVVGKKNTEDLKEALKDTKKEDSKDDGGKPKSKKDTV